MKTYVTKTRNWCRAIGCGAFCLITLSADLARSQGTVISVSGPPDTTHQFGGTMAVGYNMYGVSWISTTACSNVNIFVALDGDSGATGMAYLTTRIGLGTTAA